MHPGGILEKCSIACNEIFSSRPANHAMWRPHSCSAVGVEVTFEVGGAGQLRGGLIVSVSMANLVARASIGGRM